MSRKSYWFNCPRGFGNEYEIGIATQANSARAYRDQGYERIPREQAIRDLCYRGDAATQAYVMASVDGKQAHDRFDVARTIRDGLKGFWVYGWDE